MEVFNGATAAEPAASLDATTGEKVGADVTGELEIGEVSFDGGVLAEFGAVDFASSVAPPIPNDRVLAGLTPAVVPSDFADDKPTEAPEEKLNAVNAGADDDDEIAGLLLDTANKVEATEPAEGLSVGGTVASFGDEECEKPLLRLAEVDAAEVKWRGALSVVGAADGKTLSDDLMTSAFSVLSPLSELLTDVVSLVTLKRKRQNRLADLLGGSV